MDLHLLPFRFLRSSYRSCYRNQLSRVPNYCSCFSRPRMSLPTPTCRMYHWAASFGMSLASWWRSVGSTSTASSTCFCHPPSIPPILPWPGPSQSENQHTKIQRLRTCVFHVTQHHRDLTQMEMWKTVVHISHHFLVYFSFSDTAM